MRSLLLLFLFPLCCFAQNGTSHVLLQDALSNDIIGPRPHNTKGPEIIKIGFFVQDIVDVDEAKQSFSAKIRVVYQWSDPRLSKGWEGVRQFGIDEIWHPSIQFVNLRLIEMGSDAQTAFVDGEGNVIHVEQFVGRFTAPFNLRDFPFDHQKLFIQLHTFHSPKEVKFLINESLTGSADILTIPLSQGQAETSIVFSKEYQKEIPQFEFSFQLDRQVKFYLWKVILPMIMIVMISWGSFWISSGRIEAKIGLSAIAFLTLVVFQCVVIAYLPRLSYLTRIDCFIMVCFLAVFLALIESVIKSFLITKAARVLDITSRALFPLAFIAAIGWVFWL